jgi:Tfp pilus assembly protein PilP
MRAQATILAALAVLLALAPGLHAQAPPAPAAPPEISVPSPPPGAAAGGYSYSPQGRRDPFVSLLKPVSADQGPGKRPPGINGFLIQEVALKGIVRDAKGYTAMLLGTDNRSYFVKTGQRLFDGVITSIDATTVNFRQEVTDPLSTVKSRDVKKTLYPSEEGRQ